MRLTVNMVFNSPADFEDNGVPKVAGTAFEVRPAVLPDVAAILSIERQCGRGPLGLPAMEAAVIDPDRHVVVASMDGSVIGWAKTHLWDYTDGPAPSGHYLGGVTVLPAWRRRGVGAQLTEVRLGWIWTRVAEAWYVVNAGNLPSITLHRTWNFTEVARGSKFHTTAFRGDMGILLRARRPEPQQQPGAGQLAAGGSVLNSGHMPDSSSPLTVRRAILPGPDAGHVGRLVGAYLRQTEREKAVNLPFPSAGEGAELPANYKAEEDHPESAFENALVYLAEVGAEAVGIAIARKAGVATEIKRLWADPLVRGRGIGSALFDAVLQECPGVVRLSVWDWRTQATRLYESRGFLTVPSWDPRPGLVCMERPASRPQRARVDAAVGPPTPNPAPER